VARGDPHHGGVLYPSVQSANFFQGCSFLLMQKNIAPRWGAAAATRATTNMPARWGEEDFFHIMGRLGIVHSSLQRGVACDTLKSPNRQVGDRSFQPTTTSRLPESAYSSSQFVVALHPMFRAEHSRSARIRAAIAALFLLIGALSTPVILAAQSADECGMACCVKDGFCCCNHHHATVKGKVTEGGPRFNDTSLFAPCPQGCAPANESVRQNIRLQQRTAVPQALRTESDVRFIEHIAPRYECLASTSRTPRAPPYSSI
jgi:hypothetical protein